MDLIVFAHPDNTASHSALVLQLARNTLDNAGRPYNVIDLYSEGFDPVLPTEEYRQTVEKGFVPRNPDAKVKEYQKLILQSDRLLFIYPAWWYGPPAILKGFFDRVFTPGFAYNFLPTPGYIKAAGPIMKYFLGNSLAYAIGRNFMPVKGHLKGKRALLVNTFGGDEVAYRFFSSAPRTSVDRAVLQTTGIATTRINWFESRKDKEIPPAVHDGIVHWLKQGI